MKLAEILTGPETWYCGYTKSGLVWSERPAQMTCLFHALDTLCSIEGLPRGPEYERMARVIGVPVNQARPPWNDAYERTWDEVAAVVEAYDRDRLLNP